MTSLHFSEEERAGVMARLEGILPFSFLIHCQVENTPGNLHGVGFDAGKGALLLEESPLESNAA